MDSARFTIRRLIAVLAAMLLLGSVLARCEDIFPPDRDYYDE